MSARYSPAQRFSATKFVANCSALFANSAHASRELAAAVAQVHALSRADSFKTWTPKVQS